MMVLQMLAMLAEISTTAIDDTRSQADNFRYSSKGPKEEQEPRLRRRVGVFRTSGKASILVPS